MTDPTFASQSIHLDGVINARELGGYVMPDGRRIKHGKLLRGGALGTATDEDVRRLASEFQLSHVFDFRSDMERRRCPDREIEGALNVWLPTLDPDSGSEVDSVFSAPGFTTIEDLIYRNASNPIMQSAAKSMYSDMVFNEYTQLQYSAFMSMIISSGGKGVYWHCSQGKDRTGFGAALILAALGADRETIIADFDISNEFYADTVRELDERLAANGGGEKEFAVVQSFIGVNTKNFVDALDMIDSNFGSLHEYLLNQLSLTPSDISELQALYLE